MATNPILANPVLKATLQAQMAAQNAAQNAPAPPMPATMPGPSAAAQTPPQIGTQAQAPAGPVLPPATHPSVIAPRGTVEGDQAERSRLQSTGSGISQIGGKIENMLPNHPTLGKVLGNGLEGLARVGDVGLSAVAPSVAINLPGTEYHHAALLNRANSEVAQDEANRGKEAETAETQARVPLTQAQTAQAQEVTSELPGKTAAEEGLQGAETNKDMNPQAATADMATYQALTKMGMSPSDALKEIETDKAMALRPPNMEAKTLQLPNGQQVAGKTDSQGNLLLENGQRAPEGSKLYQQPNYGMLMLPTKTQQMLVNGIPTVMGWDEKTQQYDIPQGQSATGSYAHQEAQAGADVRAGESLISDLQANRAKLGTLSTWVQKYGLDTPIADPTLAGLQAELSTFSALQPALHGFRSHSALETFNKIIGGLQKNPDATIASIRGILKTAQNINPDLQDDNGGQHQIKVGNKTYQYKGSGATDDMKNYTEITK